MCQKRCTVEVWILYANAEIVHTRAEERGESLRCNDLIKKMRKARHTQNRREERELIRQYGYKTDYSGLPIEVVAPQRFAPLFRSSMDNSRSSRRFCV
jgi:tRNA A37 N6-isopentenylltransferase MiaA